MKPQLLNYLLEASVCQVIFYLFYRVVLRRETFFAWNRVYVLSALLLSLLIPVVEIPISQQALYLSQQPAIYAYTTAFPEEGKTVQPVNVMKTAVTNPVSAWELVYYGYICISVLLFCRLVYQIYSLYKVAAKSEKSYKNGYTLFYTKNSLPTFSFFHWIFWNHTQTLLPESENLILQHELAHIRQKHSWDMMLLELIKIVFWFNPTMYLFKRAIQEIHEYLADNTVIKVHDSNIYTNLLVRQHLGNMPVSFTHSFNQPQISKRIAMIQSAQISVKPALWKMAFALPVMAVLMCVYSCRTSEITEPKPDAQANAKGVYRLNEVLIVGYASSAPEIRQIQLNEMITGYGQSQKKPDIAVYDNADIMPEPVTGMSSFQIYLRNNVQLQPGDRNAGKVWVEFIVDTKGSLYDIKVRKGLGKIYDEEALRLIKNSPAWNPGKKNGEPVAVRKVVPVSFGEQKSETLFSQLPLISEQTTMSQPAPAEGVEAFYKKVGKTIRYPVEARKDLAEGQVWVQFTVNTDGSLSHIEVVEPLHPELDQEVVRVVSEAGMTWTPAVINGKPQATKLLFPLSFKLG